MRFNRPRMRSGRVYAMCAECNAAARWQGEWCRAGNCPPQISRLDSHSARSCEDISQNFVYLESSGHSTRGENMNVPSAGLAIQIAQRPQRAQRAQRKQSVFLCVLCGLCAKNLVRDTRIAIRIHSNRSESILLFWIGADSSRFVEIRVFPIWLRAAPALCEIRSVVRSSRIRSGQSFCNLSCTIAPICGPPLATTISPRFRCSIQSLQFTQLNPNPPRC
jgi:hypothetical protein